MPVWDSGRLRWFCKPDALHNAGPNPATGSNKILIL